MSDQEKQEKEITQDISPGETGANGPVSTRARLGRTVIALGFVSLFTDMSSEMAYTQVPLFLTGVLGASAASVGLIEGVAESTASLLRIVSGYWSDRSGQRKPLTLLGYSLGAISKPLMALAFAWQSVLLLRFVDRFGKGLRTAPRDALITETTPKELRGRAFGLHRAMDTTGAVLGPLLGIGFLHWLAYAGHGGDLGHNLRLLFVFAGLPGLLAVLTLLVAVREKAEGGRQKADEPKPAPFFLRPAAFWKTLQPSYRRFLLITLLFNLGNFSDAFLVLRARSLGFEPTEILWLYAAFNVVEAVLGYGAGILSDRVGRRPLILAGYFVFAFVYFGFGFAGSKAAIWALFLTYGLYYTLTQGVQRAFAADMADPAQRATQIGAYHTVVGVALLPASALAGVLFVYNPALPFFVGAITALLSAILLALTTKRN
jgi:MFS family permease